MNPNFESVVPSAFLPVQYRQHFYPGSCYTTSPLSVLDLCTRSEKFSYGCMQNQCQISPGSTTLSESKHMFSKPITTDEKSRSASKVKTARPFKSFPSNPMGAALGIAPSETLLTGHSSAEAYAKFRENMLGQYKLEKIENKNMKRIQSSPSADPEYLERRRKNNEAAKKSREARKAKEDEIAIRCAFLEQENIQLKFRLAELEREKNMMQRVMFY